MAEKTLQTRIVHKHDTEAKWTQATTFIPKQGELIVYDIDTTHNYERFKIGDGKTTVNALPFIDDALKKSINDRITPIETELAAVSDLVGDTAVSEQITAATDGLSDIYAPKNNPSFTTGISMNRETYSTIGKNSTSLGYYCQASGDYSFAEGYMSKATTSADAAATGSVSTTPGYCAHAEGHFSVAYGAISHAEGNGTMATGQNAHSEGNGTIASGQYSHAEGSDSLASGKASHAEGMDTEASGEYTHAEGYCSKATAYYAHAEGAETTASGSCAHAEGSHTIASGYRSHAEGDYTIAQTLNQHVEGAYNIADTEGSVSKYGRYLHIAGNGSNLGRSNAYTLDWSGNGWFAGEVYVGGANQDNASKLVKQSEIDASLNTLSTNAVQNKAVSTAISALSTLIGDATVSTQIDSAIDAITPTSIGAATSEHTHTASEVGLGNVTNDQQMPIAGGTFTGNAKAYDTNRTGSCLRNINITNSSSSNVSTNRIIMKRV